MTVRPGEVRDTFLAAIGGDPDGTAARDVGSRLADAALELASAYGSAALATEMADVVRNASHARDVVQVAVTGTGWIGGGVPSVERVLLEVIRAAKREVMLTAYSITTGSARVLEALEEALATGVRCVLLVDRFLEQPPSVRNTLERLVARYPYIANIHDWPRGDDAEGVHAKLVVADRAVALVGSANLSGRGLLTAHELAVVIRGPTAESIARLIDQLLQAPFIRRVSRPSEREPGSSIP